MTTPSSRTIDLRLPVPLYGLALQDPRLERHARLSLKKLIEKPFHQLDVAVAVTVDPESKAVHVTVKGADALVVSNYVKRTFGCQLAFTEVKEGQVLRGYLRDVGKVGFGVFVDCGLVAPAKDVLVPLVTLRDQLAGKKVSTRDVLQYYGLGDHFPVNLTLTAIDRRKKCLEGALTPAQSQSLKACLDDGLERVNVCGVTRQQLKRQVALAQHTVDVPEVSRLGWLEHQLICKHGTTAPGIITEIGPRLPGVDLFAVRPQNVQLLF